MRIDHVTHVDSDRDTASVIGFNEDNPVVKPVLTIHCYATNSNQSVTFTDHEEVRAFLRATAAHLLGEDWNPIFSKAEWVCAPAPFDI